MTTKYRALTLNQKIKVKIMTDPAPGVCGALIAITRDEFGERQFDIEYTDNTGNLKTVRLYGRQFAVLV